MTITKLSRSLALSSGIFAASVCSACGGAAARGPQSAATDLDRPAAMFDEYLDPGVVVVAFSPQGAGDPLVEVQYHIIAAAAAAGPIVVMVSDQASRELLHNGCEKEPVICEAMESGVLRVVHVDFQTAWVRDYGPQFGTDRNAVPIVLDSDYVDFRYRNSVRIRRADVDQGREKLLKLRIALQGEYKGRDEDGDFNSGSDANAQQLKEIDEQLHVLGEMSNVYSNPDLMARSRDDESPFSLAQAVIKNAQFRFVRPRLGSDGEDSPLRLDGGNLMRLGRDICATTTDIVPANGGDESAEETIRRAYGCKELIRLAPLPGPGVIRHVDMFLLPGLGKAVFLADFDPHFSPIKEHWEAADNSIQELTMDAALAMDINARALRRLGFNVIRVPSPLPTTTSDGGIYYPTLLNVSVRVLDDGRRQLIVPTYKDYEADVQGAALQVIRGGFGGNSKIAFTTVEATLAAQMQGAVHCLTLIVPKAQSIFATSESFDQGRYRSWQTRREKLKEKTESARRVAIEKEREKSRLETQELEAKERLKQDAKKALLGVWTASDKNGPTLRFREDNTLWVLQGDHIEEYRFEPTEGGKGILLTDDHGESDTIDLTTSDDKLKLGSREYARLQ